MISDGGLKKEHPLIVHQLWLTTKTEFRVFAWGDNLKLMEGYRAGFVDVLLWTVLPHRMHGVIHIRLDRQVLFTSLN